LVENCAEAINSISKSGKRNQNDDQPNMDFDSSVEQSDHICRAYFSELSKKETTEMCNRLKRSLHTQSERPNITHPIGSCHVNGDDPCKEVEIFLSEIIHSVVSMNSATIISDISSEAETIDLIVSKVVEHIVSTVCSANDEYTSSITMPSSIHIDNKINDHSSNPSFLERIPDTGIQSLVDYLDNSISVKNYTIVDWLYLHEHYKPTQTMKPPLENPVRLIQSDYHDQSIEKYASNSIRSPGSIINNLAPVSSISEDGRRNRNKNRRTSRVSVELNKDASNMITEETSVAEPPVTKVEWEIKLSPFSLFDEINCVYERHVEQQKRLSESSLLLVSFLPMI
jgi:hypothetical protein